MSPSLSTVTDPSQCVFPNCRCDSAMMMECQQRLANDGKLPFPEKRKLVIPVPKPYCKGCFAIPKGGNDDLVLIIGHGRMCGRCALATIGVEGMSKLPDYEKDKLRLSEISFEDMRRIKEPSKS